MMALVKGLKSNLEKVVLEVEQLKTVLDETAIASLENAGKIRYYKDDKNSYLEVCMESGGSFQWEVISKLAL